MLPYVDRAHDDVILYERNLNEYLLPFGPLYGCWVPVRASFVSNVLIPLLAAV
jgi:hypothetical protein